MWTRVSGVVLTQFSTSLWTVAKLQNRSCRSNNRADVWPRNQLRIRETEQKLIHNI